MIASNSILLLLFVVAHFSTKPIQAELQDELYQVQPQTPREPSCSPNEYPSDSDEDEDDEDRF